ncbi:hypothetical protein [Dongia deserti]|uniref:hypothetical protein n=1 Tax=Dongia deserti TaxID=2268030 RepID=UPI002547BAF4|nr:hypothetical protein [Dongia deserti]
MTLGFGIVLSLLGLGALCALIFQLAAYALPVYAAIVAGLYANDSGTGPVGVIALAILAGAVALVLGQLAFSIRVLPVRIVVALLFAIPAVIAGYGVVHGLSGIGDTSETWRQIFGIAGGAIAGSTALARLALPRPEATAHLHAAGPPSSVDDRTGYALRPTSLEEESVRSRGFSRRRRTRQVRMAQGAVRR